MIRLSETQVGTNLNSVWLEATILSRPVAVGIPRGRSTSRFRVHSQLPGDVEPTSVFLVEAEDSAVEGSLARLRPGRKVRIIGRLQQCHWKDAGGKDRDDVKIVGELVEPVGPPV